MVYVTSTVLALAIGSVVPVKSDDNCSTQNPLVYCGGAHGDLETEISCTPFPVKNKNLPPYKWADYCDDTDLAKFTGSSDGAKAWETPSDKFDPNPNYWVFHGCDGAGLMDDCMGGTTYVEQFGSYSNEETPLYIHTCSGEWESHCTQPFVHPGTGKVYDWYNAGQLTYSGGKWPDQMVNKPWWSNMGLPDTDQLGNGPGTAFVVMYPWVCDQGDFNSLSWLWGAHKPYANDKTYMTKCYYDNEPWDDAPDAHWTGTTPPPIWQAYKFYYDDSTQLVTGWMLAEKKADQEEPYYYYQTESPQFSLRSVGNPPWIAAE